MIHFPGSMWSDGRASIDHIGTAMIAATASVIATMAATIAAIAVIIDATPPTRPQV